MGWFRLPCTVTKDTSGVGSGAYSRTSRLYVVETQPVEPVQLKTFVLIEKL